MENFYKEGSIWLIKIYFHIYLLYIDLFNSHRDYTYVSKEFVIGGLKTLDCLFISIIASILGYITSILVNLLNSINNDKETTLQNQQSTHNGH